jgi:hypothetical protein
MYFYHSPVLDMPFYARLQSPAKVVQDWKSFRGPGSARDDWRMTLYEAGQFDPPRAHELLLDEEQFVTDLCAQPVAWVVAKARAGGAHPVLGAIAPTFRDHAYAAWRVTASDLAERGLCPQKPEVASLGKSMPIPSTG